MHVENAMNKHACTVTDIVKVWVFFKDGHFAKADISTKITLYLNLNTKNMNSERHAHKTMKYIIF